jgi:hypothetical protein
MALKTSPEGLRNAFNACSLADKDMAKDFLEIGELIKMDSRADQVNEGHSLVCIYLRVNNKKIFDLNKI